MTMKRIDLDLSVPDLAHGSLEVTADMAEVNEYFKDCRNRIKVKIQLTTMIDGIVWVIYFISVRLVF